MTIPEGTILLVGGLLVLNMPRAAGLILLMVGFGLHYAI